MLHNLGTDIRPWIKGFGSSWLARKPPSYMLPLPWFPQKISILWHQVVGIVNLAEAPCCSMDPDGQDDSKPQGPAQIPKTRPLALPHQPNSPRILGCFHHIKRPTNLPLRMLDITAFNNMPQYDNSEAKNGSSLSTKQQQHTYSASSRVTTGHLSSSQNVFPTTAPAHQGLYIIDQLT
ncbi:hypothetical protein PtA15_9A247 [Puccinia triticina]|uniref:Uncharacterized protein n=1 Tax=Puccinia triticina TaxID=208348 RepID=A0ABY7CZJ4_9BASI|nr:uncharacterized protein PtA15_9A247 [Puccinia triticina]WAQ88122.1 hypothetical protein PtA15_9A247 [Puccinia triticina]WAR60310.1 hypothetical protein PtB15_9B247 [Puccinia triticina]